MSVTGNPYKTGFRARLLTRDRIARLALVQVWDLSTLNLRARLNGHTGAVLALQLVREREWLISGSGESLAE